MAFLEIACFNLRSAEIAAGSGADRIEFCSDLSSGGLTPGVRETEILLKQVQIPVYVMIRPVGGGFFYTNEQIVIMRQSISDFKSMGVHGFIFGMLDKNGGVDVPSNSVLLEHANPLPCTFHRAFDRTLNYEDSLERVIQCGFSTLLTSGHPVSAFEGRKTLRNLIEQTGDRISIMPGGGIRSSNIREIRMETGATYFHSAALMPGSIYPDPAEIRNLKHALD